MGPEDQDLPDGDDNTSLHARRAVAGDRESVAWVVSRLSPFLRLQAEIRLPVSVRRLVDPEDLVADVWAATLPRLGEIRPAEGHYARVVVKYISTVLLHRVRDLARRAARDRLRPSREGGADSRVDGFVSQLSADDSGVVSRVLREERRGAVWRALEALSPEDRRLLVLRGIEQQPLTEVAAQLEVSPGTLAVRYHRALKKLSAEVPDAILAGLAESG